MFNRFALDVGFPPLARREVLMTTAWRTRAEGRRLHLSLYLLGNIPLYKSMELTMIEGNSRRTRKISTCLGAMLMALAAAAHATTDTSTMTIGIVNTGFGVWTGFSCCGYGNFGSMSPSTLTGGKVYERWFDIGSSLAYFTLGGFTSNPGSSWLSSASCLTECTVKALTEGCPVTARSSDGSPPLPEKK